MVRRRRRTIAIDFDGVIHRYSRGWQDGSIYDEPVEGAREALARLHRQFRVVILTTRVNPDMRDPAPQRAAMRRWLQHHGFREGEHYDAITHVKVPALVYIDDRALHFTGWAEALAIFDERLGGV